MTSRRTAPPKLPPPRPGAAFSGAAFDRQVRRFLRSNPGLTKAKLTDQLRACAQRLNAETNEWEPVSGTTIYNWRKGVGEPATSDSVNMARVLGCAVEDFAA